MFTAPPQGSAARDAGMLAQSPRGPGQTHTKAQAPESQAPAVSETPDLKGLICPLWKCLIPFLKTFLEGFLLF